ncbi:hypothetical protein GCM10010172_51270 [Paractinoplanes ferrugineus]|uniref:Uncharacterized protein n=1 Tax=Paractinoplanes ferrugineus TaxID=113564 RepID=A0A919J058_9ACTN|nr:hypothetical protein Afe05nite_38950 [Actinoplanes ferrugineus]
MRHAPNRVGKSVRQATAGGDQLAETSPAETLRLCGLACFRIGESREQLKTATATIGVEPWR